MRYIDEVLIVLSVCGGQSDFQGHNKRSYRNVFPPPAPLLKPQ
jgi:hypothetical protein